jgi:hypothetical protein
VLAQAVVRWALGHSGREQDEETERWSA